MAKQETLRVAQYLVAKDGKTKYLKFGHGPNADQATKDAVAAIQNALGGDVLYVNIFDEAFKTEHNIPEFVKGGISLPVADKTAQAPAAAPQQAPKKTATKGTDW